MIGQLNHNIYYLSTIFSPSDINRLKVSKFTYPGLTRVGAKDAVTFKKHTRWFGQRGQDDIAGEWLMLEFARRRGDTWCKN